MRTRPSNRTFTAVARAPRCGALLDEARTIALDLATVVATKANRYPAVAALLTLGQDKEVAEAVRTLSPKVTEVMEFLGDRDAKFEHVSDELQESLEEFRDFADIRLGSVTPLRPRKTRRGSRPSGDQSETRIAPATAGRRPKDSHGLRAASAPAGHHLSPTALRSCGSPPS